MEGFLYLGIYFLGMGIVCYWWIRYEHDEFPLRVTATLQIVASAVLFVLTAAALVGEPWRSLWPWGALAVLVALLAFRVKPRRVARARAQSGSTSHEGHAITVKTRERSIQTTE